MNVPYLRTSRDQLSKFHIFIKEISNVNLDCTSISELFTENKYRISARVKFPLFWMLQYFGIRLYNICIYVFNKA